MHQALCWFRGRLTEAVKSVKSYQKCVKIDIVMFSLFHARNFNKVQLILIVLFLLSQRAFVRDMSENVGRMNRQGGGLKTKNAY